jgi:hypothetical protein
MHLRVAGAGGVLGRRRRSDDGGIDDRPAPDDPSLTLEDLGLRREQLLRDLVASSRCRKWSSVVASGTCSIAESRSMNLRIA